MFFSLNHPNFALWIVKYHNSLLTLEEMHSETFREYQNGMFNVNRTTKFFQEAPSILHWNKRLMLMQLVRELVLLP